MKAYFPRTIRLDGTDTRVFELAAAPGEWAVTGAFVFADADPAAVTGKQRQAFRNGFLGLESFGWSTFVVVARIEDSQYEAAVDALARHLLEHFGAPDMDAAIAAAAGEAAFAASLCDHRVNTLLAMDRSHGEEGIVERIRVLQPEGGLEAVKVWEIADEP